MVVGGLSTINMDLKAVHLVGMAIMGMALSAIKYNINQKAALHLVTPPSAPMMQITPHLWWLHLLLTLSIAPSILLRSPLSFICQHHHNVFL